MKNPWSRNTKYFVISLYIIGLVWLLFSIQSLLAPIIIAVLLAYILSSIVNLFTRRFGWRRERAAILAFILFLLVMVGIPSSFTPILVRQINRVAMDVDNILGAVESFVETPIQIGQFTLDPPRDTIANLDQEIRALVGSSSSRAIEAVSNLGANVVGFIILIVLTYYLLRDGPRLRAWFIHLIPKGFRSDADRLLHEIDLVWGIYLRGQVILAAIIGVLTGTSMALIGLRGALLIGIIAGVLDLIPSLGPLVGGFIAVIVALVLGSTRIAVPNFWFGVIVGGIFVLIQQFENIWLAPKILGGRLKMHPALVVVGVLGALTISGILGALIVIPIMASVFILSRYVQAMLQDRSPWPDPTPAPDPSEEMESALPEGVEERL